MVVTDRLRVRSKPRVASDSAKYEPVLRYGSDLSVLAGPVGASGYWWYKVHLEDGLHLDGGRTVGWVAAGDHDGEAWIEVVHDGLPGPDTDPEFPAPDLVAVGSEDAVVDGVSYTRYAFSVVNWAQYPEDLFEPEPDLEPCGLSGAASRTWVTILDATEDADLNTFCGLSTPEDLVGIWFATPKASVAPAEVSVSLWDRLTDSLRTSNSVVPVRSPSSPAP